MNKIKIKFKGLIELKKVKYDGVELLPSNLEKILSIITTAYMYAPRETADISSKRLSHITNYRKYLNYLVEQDIIYVNEHYQVGKFTKSYGFTDNFKARIDLIPEFVVRKTKKKSSINNVSTKMKQRIAVDFQRLKIVGSPVKLIDSDSEGNVYYHFKSWLTDCYNVYSLDNNVSFYHWVDFRLYNNFGACSSATRKNCFTLKGEAMKCVDIKTSYPMFLAKWLKDNNYSNSWDFVEWCESVFHTDFYLELRRVYESNPYKARSKHYSRIWIKEIFASIVNGKNNKDEHNLLFERQFTL